MNKYDQIEVVEKGVDEVEVVEKFNPFHDSRGRFSNKNGFSSYSANPNTRAGAMAIARSAAAGHGTTMNVHRDAKSTGPTIRHNANWLGSGHQLNSRWQGSGTLRNRVEPVAGLAGASATGASWQAQNSMSGRTTTPGKQPTKQPQQAQQQPQKPAPAQQAQNQQAQQKPAQLQNTSDPNQTLASKMSDVYLSSGDKLANQPRNGSGQTTTTTNVAKSHYQDRVDGKDISGTVDVTKIRGSADPIDKIAKLQGWNKAPTVTDDLEVFQKAAKKSGCVVIRSVTSNMRTGQSANEVCKSTMTDGDSPLGGSGGKWYGAGMYMVKTTYGTDTGRSLAKKINQGQQESYYYGGAQMMATVHPKAKIATPKQAQKMQTDYYSLSSSQQRKYGGYGEYIAAKGYDGAQWHDSSSPTAYVTIYNKSSLIFYSGVAKQ